MPTGGRATLTQFLIEERRRVPDATGELNALITDLSLACKAIACRVAFGALDASRGIGAGASSEAPMADAGTEVDRPANLASDTEGDTPPPGAGHPGQALTTPLERNANALFLRANEWGGHVAGMVSAQMAGVHTLPARFPRGKYLLMFDPLDGSSSTDVNVAVGSIFAVALAPVPQVDAKAEDFLQPGTDLVCAGYAIYGPSTMLVLSLGRGTHAFTLDPMLGEWVLSHPNLRVPETTREFAINASNSRFWEPAVKRYVDECLAGQTGSRGGDFGMRWIASLVAETHRILMRGGVFLDPRDARDQRRGGRVGLLYEANPIAFVIEQAGGRASHGRGRLLELQPEGLHQRVGLVFGSAAEVARIERYHHEEPFDTFSSPLFGRRGLFAQPD